MHSFIGLGTVILYSANYIAGVSYFAASQTLGIADENKAIYLPNHVFIGLFTFFLATMAVETGVMELFTELGCGYDVTQADMDPAKHYHKLASGCQVANGVGIMALFTCLLAFYSAIPSANQQIPQEKQDLLRNEMPNRNSEQSSHNA